MPDLGLGLGLRFSQTSGGGGGGGGNPSVDGTPVFNTNGFADTISVTIPSVKAGDYIVAQLTNAFVGSTPTASSPGLTFTTLEVAQGQGGGDFQNAVFGAYCTEAATDVEVTVSISSGNWLIAELAAFTVSGVNESAPLDPQTPNPVSAQSNAATITTSNAADLLLYFYCEDGLNTLTAPEGWTIVYQGNQNAGGGLTYFCAAYSPGEIVTSETYTLGNTTGVQNTSILLALQ